MPSEALDIFIPLRVTVNMCDDSKLIQRSKSVSRASSTLTPTLSPSTHEMKMKMDLPLMVYTLNPVFQSNCKKKLEFKCYKTREKLGYMFI